MPKRKGKIGSAKIRKKPKPPKPQSVRVDAREVWENAHRDDVEIKNEYRRLRDIAQKRLKRMETAGYTDLDAYAMNVNHYPAPSAIADKWEMAARLSDLQRFINARSSTITGIKESRAKTLQTWRNRPGFDWLNEGNLSEWGHFLNFMKTLYPNVYALELYRGQEDFQAYRKLRDSDLTGKELQRYFEDYIKKTRPDSLLIDPNSRRVPNEYRQSPDSKRR